VLPEGFLRPSGKQEGVEMTNESSTERLVEGVVQVYRTLQRIADEAVRFYRTLLSTDRDMQQFVKEVVKMYRTLQGVDRETLEMAGYGHIASVVQFHGFNGKHEIEHFSYVRELERKGALGGLSYWKGLDCHLWLMVNRYKAMLKAYRLSPNLACLTAEDVKRIINAFDQEI
jgi:uncharacterized protein YfbU (UPF0304 family)